MNKYFRRFPPIYQKPGNGSRNGMFYIYVGRDEKYPPATFAQEYREFWIGWTHSYGPSLFGIVLALAGVIFGSLIVSGIGLGISAIATAVSRLPAVCAYRGIRGQVTEACAAAWLYDVPLEGEIETAARQLIRSYTKEYGLKGKSQADIEKICWRLVPGETQWVSDHRKLITDARTWLEG